MHFRDTINKKRGGVILNGSIYKFERDMLRGEAIHINKKSDRTGFKKHWHNYYEIIYYRNCVGYCILNGERFELSDNCLFLLTPKDFHEIVTEESPDSSSYIIAFSEQIVDKKILASLTAGPFTLYSPPPCFSEKIEELYGIFKVQSKRRDLHLSHLFNCILIDILDNGIAASAILRDINPIVRESISLMLVEPSKNFTLELFAEKFRVTPTYFSRLFHESTGVPFKQYLTGLRIECAKRMLEEKELPIIDVGYECGFNTPSQFIRAFKKSEGITPSEYRVKKAKSV